MLLPRTPLILQLIALPERDGGLEVRSGLWGGGSSSKILQYVVVGHLASYEHDASGLMNETRAGAFSES